MLERQSDNLLFVKLCSSSESERLYGTDYLWGEGEGFFFCMNRALEET